MKPPIIDTNVNLSRWPFRRLPEDETPRLVAKLRSHRVVQAWAGSFDALLHRDIAAVNERLADECRKFGEGVLVPFGTVNPTLPDWREDLRRCDQQFGMPGLRLHPGYHDYRLDDDCFAELLELAAERRLVIQIVLMMEDERTQHPRLRIPAVDPAPLIQRLKDLPELRVVMLNAFRTVRSDQAAGLAAAGHVYFDIAMLEGTGGLGKMASLLPPERLLFGSHAPFYYFESALLKLRESPLGGKLTGWICHENAARLLKRSV